MVVMAKGLTSQLFPRIAVPCLRSRGRFSHKSKEASRSFGLLNLAREKLLKDKANLAIGFLPWLDDFQRVHPRLELIGTCSRLIKKTDTFIHG